jgi:hypothetical protein
MHLPVVSASSRDETKRIYKKNNRKQKISNKHQENKTNKKENIEKYSLTIRLTSEYCVSQIWYSINI